MSGSSSSQRRLYFDLISATVLLAVALGGCYLPRFLSLRGKATGNERSLVFQLGNMLSAGVMLSAGFCHLLADALKPTQAVVPHFPLAPFLCALGYLLILTANTYASRASGHSHHKVNGNNPLLSPYHQPSDRKEAFDGEGFTEVLEPDPENQEPEAVNGSRVESLQIENNQNSVEPRVSFLTAMFLGVALSLHSILEGLALGAQQTVSASRDVLLAVAAHKGLAAYALGASLVDSQTSFVRFWKVAGSFSAASPIGILIGYGLSEVSNNAGAASLSALASGTFLYVAMMEVIPKELHDGENITPKLLIMFVGFGAMSLLALWA